MENFISAAEKVNSAVNSFAWGPFMLMLLAWTGIYLSIKTGFIQIRKFKVIMKSTVGSLFRKKKEDTGENLSPFQAVTTALAGSIGTGNIAGVTAAIFAGGPGAVFWMWVSAFFGMCTKYAEILLSVKFREKDKSGKYFGGPMYYIEKGLGAHFKFLALLFALFGGLASFGIGNIAQSSEISGALSGLFGLSPLASGIIIAAVVSSVVIGGVKRIGHVTSYIVPFMSVFYILACTFVILLRIRELPFALLSIFKGAFSFRSIGGGAAGYAMANAIRQGFAKGVFSNEAGLGSSPMAHASSSEKEPARQAMWGIFEVFTDTILICTFTAFSILLSGITEAKGGLSSFVSSGAAAAEAFDMVLPGSWGGTAIRISVVFFALSSILGWCCYGQVCFGYITKGNKTALYIYKVLFILFCIVGATGSGTLMWDISDTLNGLMAIPNLTAVLLLSGVTAAETKKYFKKL